MKLNLLKKGIVAMACLPLAMVAGNAVASGFASTATKAFPETTATRIGSLSEDRVIHVTVSLKLRDFDGLKKTINSMADRSSFMYGRSLSSEEMAQYHYPTAEQASAVVHFLQMNGFSNIQVASNHLLVEADAKVGNVKSAFNTDFAEFKLDGKHVFANTRDAQVPSHLKDLVLAVGGLHDFPTVHTNYHVDASPNAAGGINPASFPTAYGFSSSTNASNTVVGIISEGNISSTLSDLSTFESRNGITPVSVTTEGPGGTDTSGAIEWNLDSQTIVGNSGGVKQLIFYNGSGLTDSALTTDFNLVVSDNKAKAINVSLGECEKSAKTSGAMATDDQIFASATAQGQTFFVSSGDSGAKECKIFFFIKSPGDSYMASSPYVTSVGGTSLNLTSGGTYSSETVWSGTGGAPSLEEAKPSWQNGVSGITNNMRGVPDVAADADPSTGAILVYKGVYGTQVGGTSLAAPLWTSTWARAQTVHGNSLGFAAPLIYASSKSFYHDVTSGSNGGYSAASGWDYCTGWGSPVGDSFVNGI